MTPERIAVAQIRRLIQNLPPHLEEACLEMAEHMRRMRDAAGPPVGELAIALVGAELAAETEEQQP